MKKINANFDIELRDFQSDFELNVQDKLSGLLISGRQNGKSFLARYVLVKRGLQAESGINLAYVCPFLSQARKIFWPALKIFLSPIISHCIVREADLSIKLPNGATIWLCGADNEAARGNSFHTIIVDEFDNIPPETWASVFLPTTASFKTPFILYIGTLKRSNSKLWKLYEQNRDNDNWHCAIVKSSEAGVLDSEQLDRYKLEMGETRFLLEFECDPYAPSESSILGDLIYIAENEGRVRSVPISPIKEVITCWDIGISDASAVWLVQVVNDWLQIIGYREYNGIGLDRVVHALKEEFPRVTWGDTCLPWDISARDIMTGRSRLETFESFNFGNPFSMARFNVADSLHAARINLSRCVFDRDNCELGLQRLKAWEYAVDVKTGCTLDKAKHDENSHCGDSFRYLMAQCEIDFPCGSMTCRAGSVIRSV